MVVPFARLVVAWREAKTCLQAITAARTGTVLGLRLDDRRPALRDPVGDVPPGTSPNIAVGAVTILTDCLEFRIRAMQYVERRREELSGISIEALLVPPGLPVDWRQVLGPWWPPRPPCESRQ